MSGTVVLIVVFVGYLQKGERGTGESGKLLNGNTETASVRVFDIFLYEAAANNVYHIVRSLCFHLWASSKKSKKTSFTQNL